MAKFSTLSRMPKADHSDSTKNDKKKRKKYGGKGHPDEYDSDSSVDSKGNIRDLINYDSSSDEDITPSEPTCMKRPTRKAALVARTKIKKMSKSIDKSKSNNSKQQNTIHYPKVTRKSSLPPTPTTKSTPSSSKSSGYYLIYDMSANKHKSYHKSTTNDEDTMTEDSEYDQEEEDNDDEEEDEYSEDEEYSDDDDEKEEYSEDDDEEEEEEEEEEEDKQNEEEEEEEEEYDEDETPSSGKASFGQLLLSLASGGRSNTMIPTKHKMKKEPEIVKRFVKLLTTPIEENTIDTQIDQFKKLTDEKQKELVSALENRPTVTDSSINLMLKIVTLKLPPDVQAMVLSKYNSLQSIDPSTNEYYKLRAWLDKLVSIPFGVYKDIPVRLEEGSEKCTEFMRNARKCLDQATYGQEDPKLQIMQFISTKIANPAGKGLSLLLVGPPGIGKTTIIKNGIAKALGWPFQFISLGGDSDASTYTGHQLVYESSHCGKIVNSLVASKSMSTVLMFDEIDKISQTAKGEEIMNLLVHLTDPVQNSEFEDKYLSGIPIDLSKVMFIFSANDITKIDRVLLDRMIVIHLKGYDLKQKTTIAEQYLLPEALKEVNLTEKVAISKEILTSIIQEYANEEQGVRELKRCIDQITQKINMLRMYNSPELPFYIKDFSLPFIVKKDHIKLFLKRKDQYDAPPYGMYL
jgi:ATP-dependent Lon protease